MNVVQLTTVGCRNLIKSDYAFPRNTPLFLNGKTGVLFVCEQ
jgi:hypothetical protein